MANAQRLLSSVLGDGARATKYDVAFAFSNPAAFPQAKDLAILCKATQFPGISHSTINLQYKGRSIPIRGQTKYSQTWECSFYLPENHALKQAFEAWVAALDEMTYYNQTPNSYEKGTRAAHRTKEYVTDVTLYQLSFDETKETCKYTLYNVFPIEVAPIQASADSPGAIEELVVTFSYSHFLMQASKGNSRFNNLISQVDSAGLNIVTDSLNSFLASASEMVSNVAGEALESFADAAMDETLRKLELGCNLEYQLPNFVNTSVRNLVGGVLSRFS